MVASLSASYTPLKVIFATNVFLFACVLYVLVRSCVFLFLREYEHMKTQRAILG